MKCFEIIMNWKLELVFKKNMQNTRIIIIITLNIKIIIKHDIFQKYEDLAPKKDFM